MPSGTSSPSRSGMNSRVGRRPDPHAAEADLQAADEIRVPRRTPSACRNVPSPSVSSKIRIRSRASSSGSRTRVLIGLGHPQPTAIVEAPSRSAAHVGFGGEQLNREAGRHRHRLGRLGRREPVSHGSLRLVASAGLDTAADTRDHGDQGDGPDDATTQRNCNPGNEEPCTGHTRAEAPRKVEDRRIP